MSLKGPCNVPVQEVSFERDVPVQGCGYGGCLLQGCDHRGAVGLDAKGDASCNEMQLRKLGLIEIFSGSGSLTARARARALKAIAVDWRGNRHREHARALHINLSETSAKSEVQKLIDDMYSMTEEFMIWFEPPSGTASRAREIHLRSPNAPQPLRSDAAPLGIAGLEGIDKAKVEEANRLYALTAEVISELPAGVLWCIANPVSSLMWLIPYIVALQNATGAVDVDFTCCNFGSKRPKRMRLRTNCAKLLALQGPCSGVHPHRHVQEDGLGVLHAPWGFLRKGEFPAREEAEYPAELCDAILDCVFPQTKSAPGEEKSNDIEEAECARIKHPHKIARAAGVGRQARGRGGLRVVAEFREKVWAEAVSINQGDAVIAWASLKGRRLARDLEVQGVAFHAGDQLLNIAGRCVGGPGGSGNFRELVLDQLRSQGRVAIAAGRPWQPVEHFEMALYAEHPFSNGYPLRARTAAGLAMALRLGPEGLRRHQQQHLARWAELGRNLLAKEASLHEQLPDDIAKVVAEKKLLLFEAILRDIGYSDMEAVRMMAGGFPVVGWIPDSLEFPPKLVEPKSGIRELLTQARALQRAAKLGTQASKDPELDREVYEATLKEVNETGLMRGPISEAELSEKHGLWIPARRFGLRQGNKVRPIDDFSECGQNATVGTAYKVDLGGVDEIVAIARAWASALACGGYFEVWDEDGNAHSGEVHPGWRTGPAQLQGCCLDLEAAFRQLPRSVAHAAFTVVSVFNPYRQVPEFFELKALAFGQGAAVYGFNRVARAIDAIFSHLGVVSSNYVDDYPLVAPKIAAQSNLDAGLAVLGILGWKVKKPFELAPAGVFNALGVIVDLDAVDMLGVVEVRNKPERIRDDVATIQDLLEAGAAKPSVVRRLRGRLQYASSQTFGRCGAFASRLLKGLACSLGGPRQCSALEILGLEWWQRHLVAAVPRRVQVRDPRRPVLLFTDGAVEDLGCTVTVGGLIAVPDLHVLETFGEVVPAGVVEQWRSDGCGRQVIGQAELAPVSVSVAIWDQLLEGREVIIFIDNDSARDAMIRGYSPSLASARIIGEAWARIAQLAASVWFERVPGVSNIADGPSRLDFSVVEAIGARRRRIADSDWRVLGGAAGGGCA